MVDDTFKKINEISNPFSRLTLLRAFLDTYLNKPELGYVYE